MAITITTTLSRALLQSLLPDFDVKADSTGWVREQVRALAEAAIEAGAVPMDAVLSSNEANLKVNFSLGGGAENIVRSGARDFGNSPGKYIRALLTAFAAKPLVPVLAPQKETALSVVVSTLGLADSPEQNTFFQQVCDSLRSGSVGLCEAGTGTGKTLAIVVAAIDLAKRETCRVLVTAPTIELLRQFAREYARVAGVTDAPDLRVVFGRREFVSPSAIMSLLDSGAGDFDYEAIAKWVEEVGASLARNPETGEVIASDVLTQKWLSGSLALVAGPAFPLDEVLLGPDTEPDDPGLASYQAQFANRLELPEIMLASHAMVAIDLRSKIWQSTKDEELVSLDAERRALLAQIRDRPDDSGLSEMRALLRQIDRDRARQVSDLSEESSILPPYSYVIVDEAHQLESNFSSALSDYVSVKAFSRLLVSFKNAGGKVSQIALKNAESIIARINDISDLETDEMISLGSERGLRLAPLIADLAATLGKIPIPKGSAELIGMHRRIQRSLTLLRNASRAQGLNNAFIKLSPVRMWPQIYIGQRSVDRYLQLLWDSTRAGVAASATLYLRRGEAPSASYQRMLLAIPEGRAREFPPVATAWSIRPIQAVFVPQLVRAESGAIWLRPPSRSDRLSPEKQGGAEMAWLTQVRDVLMWVYRTAAGGVFVPMTSYSSIKQLTSLLPENVRASLVCATPDFSLGQQTARYVKLYQQGKRPLWLAVGGAWTGLDLNGKHYGIEDPATDNLITDLVVPKLPFGSNRTITHQYRLSRYPNIQWEPLDVAFRVKQVIGRPVRRAGLPQNRRFFMLDGRLVDPAFAGYTGIIHRMFEAFKRKTLSPETLDD